jgi:hypothetical protein
VRLEEAMEEQNQQPSPTEPSRVLETILKWFHDFHIDREKSKAADWAIFLVTTLGMVAAFASAVFLEIQIQDTRRSFKLDERAWIELETINVIHQERQKVYEFYPKNVGKTVAHDVEMKLTNFVAEPGSLPNSVIDCIHWVWQPNASISKTQKVERTTGTKWCNGVAQDELSGVARVKEGRIPSVIAQNEKVITPWVVFTIEPLLEREANFFVGRIDYVDNFGIAHWKKFCIYEELNEFLSCKTGNEEDENPE